MTLISRYGSDDLTEDQFNIDKHVVRYSLFISGSLIIAIWLIKLFEWEYNLDFSSWGIMPLKLTGLRGIIFSPLIHSSFGHLAANTVPLFVLTFSLFFFYRKPSFVIFISIYLLSGFFVWLTGREALHIGASGIIYGLAAFLFLSGILSHNTRLLTISLIVAFLYGYMFWGIFPLKQEVSWESHLWGGVAGFGLALFYNRIVKTEINRDEEENEEDEEDDSEEKNESDTGSPSL